MFMVVIMFQMHVELGSGDGRFIAALNVQVITADPKLRQFVLQRMEIDAEIEQGTKEHVAADAAEYIEVKCAHELISSRLRQPVNLAGGKCRAKSIVDVHYRDTTPATIQHAE